MDLYKTDKLQMINEGVLNKTYLALSREPSIPKVSWRFERLVTLGIRIFPSRTSRHLHAGVAPGVGKTILYSDVARYVGATRAVAKDA